MNHVGVSVSSLEETLAWYEEMLGLEASFEALVVGEKPSGHRFPDGRSVDVAFVRLGGGFIEFLEYRGRGGKPFELRNSDVGAMHICFEVDDIHVLHRHLKSRGVSILGEPAKLGGVGEGDLDGVWYFYFRDHQGIQLEAFQVPEGSAVSSGTRRLSG